MAFIPRNISRIFDLGRLPADTHQAVLQFTAYGLAAGNNLSISIVGESGEMLYELQPANPIVKLRAATWRDLAISLLRACRAGLLLEKLLVRSNRSSKPAFFYELPANKLCAGGKLLLSVQRLTKHPVYFEKPLLQWSAQKAEARVEHTALLEGYCHSEAIEAGDSAVLSLHSNTLRTVNCSLVHFGASRTELQQPVPVTVEPQTVFSAGYRLNPQWPVTLKIPTNKLYTAGLYGILVKPTEQSTEHLSEHSSEHSGQYCVPLIIKRHPSKHKQALMVIASTNTWAAYNEWGGASLYHWRGADSLGRSMAHQVSRLRPNSFADPVDGDNHLAKAHAHLNQWLCREKIDYDICSDLDVESDNDIFEGYSAVMFDAHAEYWTLKAIQRLRAFTEGGGSLISLSGNELYWRTELIDDLVEVVKPSGVHSSGAAGGLWADVADSESTITGVAYTPLGDNTYAPYRVDHPTHWIFAGTDVTEGDTFGEQGLFGAASGHETNKINRATPAGTMTLATGLNGKRAGAHMVVRERPEGNITFAAGSTTFIGSLGLDKVCDQILLNVLEKAGIYPAHSTGSS